VNDERRRVVHFVSGGGSGATRVAADLALAQFRDPTLEPHLVLRDKGRPLPPSMEARIRAAALPLHWVSNRFPRRRVVRDLERLCETIEPVAFFAHGYSEHLWGRRAASRVPLVIHVEHNIERYLPWRVWAARRLVAHTAATVCVSTAVEAEVRRLRIGAPRTEVLYNGIDVGRFGCASPLSVRRADILVPARFARSKDQPTLVRAAQRLRERGWGGLMIFAGGGKASHREGCERLVRRLDLESQVVFPGVVDDLPSRFATSRVVALASRREGLPLVIAEAMSAGCAVVASRIPGITDIVCGDGASANGWLFTAGDDRGAADALWSALTQDEEAQRRADAGRSLTAAQFSLAAMVGRYQRLLEELFASLGPSVLVERPLLAVRDA
jgi:glycosyltransferase involved in cell wall biosynthesis